MLVPKDKILELVKYFEKYSFIEYASLKPKFNKPPPPPSIPSSNLRNQKDHLKEFTRTLSPYSILTPDFTSLQGYLKGNVENDFSGIDIEHAWSLGIYGQGVKAADIEWGMDYNHEDLISPNFVELIETGNHIYDSHGTAVCGILIGKNNGFGITGAVHKLDTLYGLSHHAYQGTEFDYRPEYTILEALKKLDKGDVLILEMQSSLLEPIDIDQSIWDIINEATDSGIIVVEAAGNGSINLDDSTYNNYRNRGDNGAIIVGSGRKTRQRLSGTYGSRVNLQAWGTGVVTTGGNSWDYGNLFNGGEFATYTNTFNGTSSATAIVASAVISLQSYAKNAFNKVLSPKEIRDILISTGTPQRGGNHIGPLPNVKKAFEKLEYIILLDTDNDGVLNQNDQCPNTPSGAAVNTNGCITVPSNNFTIEVKGETCPGKKNGKIFIISNETYNCIATINNTSYNFTNNSLTISNLASGTYEMCITVSEYNTFKQCYSIVMEAGEIISGKASLTLKKASIEIEKGTSPYTIFRNGTELFRTSNPSFSLNVLHGDLIEVKTAKSCEGVFSKTIDLIEGLIVFPNPTNGIFEIELPESLKEIKITLFSTNSQKISAKMYSVINGKVKLNIENNPTGIYFVKVHLENPLTFKILKK